MDFLKTKFNGLMNASVPPLKVKHLVIGTTIVVGVMLMLTSKNRTVVLVGNH
jgi:hypothetical protein